MEDAFGCIAAQRNDLRSIKDRLDAVQTQLSGLETAFSEIRSNHEFLKGHLERLVVLTRIYHEEQIESLQSDAHIRDVQLNQLQCSCAQTRAVQQELGDVTHVLMKEIQRNLSGLQVDPQKPERVASRSPRRVLPRSQRISSGLADGISSTPPEWISSESGQMAMASSGTQQAHSSHPVRRPTRAPENSRIRPTQAPDLMDLQNDILFSDDE